VRLHEPLSHRDGRSQRSACAAVEIAVGDVSDYGFVKTAEAVDPAGNKELHTQREDAERIFTADTPWAAAAHANPH
jgi:hypothetical protein